MQVSGSMLLDAYYYEAGFITLHANCMTHIGHDTSHDAHNISLDARDTTNVTCGTDAHGMMRTA